ncbi:MAG: hypothetical protein K5927_07640 [Lachnospiraceae bacterium]|nr:hypothetical protein [Lachnospiraceae bacterium]
MNKRISIKKRIASVFLTALMIFACEPFYTFATQFPGLPGTINSKYDLSYLQNNSTIGGYLNTNTYSAPRKILVIVIPQKENDNRSTFKKVSDWYGQHGKQATAVGLTGDTVATYFDVISREENIKNIYKGLNHAGRRLINRETARYGSNIAGLGRRLEGTVAEKWFNAKYVAPKAMNCVKWVGVTVGVATIAIDGTRAYHGYSAAANGDDRAWEEAGFTSKTQTGARWEMSGVAMGIGTAAVGVASAVGLVTLTAPAAIGLVVIGGGIGLANAFGGFAKFGDWWNGGEDPIKDTTKMVPTGKRQNAEKPNIYIYSDDEENVTVTFSYPDMLTDTIPLYQESWKVLTCKDGKLLSGDDMYGYLYYESETDEKLFEYEEGWIIEADERKAMFESILAEYGFNEKEINDFTDYWVERLPEDIDYVMYPQEGIRVDTAMPIQVDPIPDSMTRIWFVFRPFEGQGVCEPSVVKIVREGLTVVEWGGVVLNN